MLKTPAGNQSIGSYLSGYADGEGSFCVSFSPRSKLKIHIEVRPSFSVSQNFDRREVLDLYVAFFKCGTIRRNSSDKTFKYEVRSLDNIIEKIIPHFFLYPLLSSKQQDFEKFARICDLMKNGRHHITSDLKKILDLAYTMNSSGTRKYKKEFLLRLIS